jgi:hypothetical protein
LMTKLEEPSAKSCMNNKGNKWDYPPPMKKNKFKH